MIGAFGEFEMIPLETVAGRSLAPISRMRLSTHTRMPKLENNRKKGFLIQNKLGMLDRLQCEVDASSQSTETYPLIFL